MIYHFSQKEQKWERLKNSQAICILKKRLCCTNKKFKTSTESLISIEKVHRIIKLSQITWLIPCLDLNTELTKIVRNDLEYFSKLMIKQFKKKP